MIPSINQVKKIIALALLPTSLLFCGHRTHDLSPTVSVSNTGTTVALWEDDSDPIHAIYTNTLSSGTWTPKEKLSVEGVHSTMPRLYMNALGECVATWLAIDQELRTTVLYAAIRTSDGNWIHNARLTQSDELVDETSSHASINDSGSITVCWESILLENNADQLSSCIGSVSGGWGPTEKIQ